VSVTLLPTSGKKEFANSSAALEADDQFSSFPQRATRPLQIVVSIPIEAVRQLTQSARLQQVGFGSLLNLAPGDDGRQFGVP
jgi:hypothetical protein